MQNKGAYKVLERDIVGTSLDTHSLIAKSYHAHSDRRSSFRHTDYSKSNDIFQVASQMNVKLSNGSLRHHLINFFYKS